MFLENENATSQTSLYHQRIIKSVVCQPNLQYITASIQSLLETAHITSEELHTAAANLKKGKASGPDNISIQHLGDTGRRLMASYTPQSLKDGLVLPLHKGKGKNPRAYKINLDINPI